MTQRITSRLLMSLTMAVLLAGGIFFASPQAHADSMDIALMRNAPKAWKYLRKHGYDNVGVLTFRVQKAGRKATFRSGLINTNMADRLERALIMTMDPSKPVGIIGEASEYARKQLTGAGYRTPSQRRKLFDVKYRLPVGSERRYVSADAFLTGKVAVSKDFATTTVTLESFDRKEPGTHKRILQFDVKTDRNLLADLGQGFSTSRRGMKFMRGADDDDIIEVVQDDMELIESDDEDAEDDLYEESFPVQLKIYYDGEEQELDEDAYQGSNNFTMDDPQEGEVIEFGVKNTTDDTLGIVLLVNGYSTLYAEHGLQPKQFSKWVLQPGKSYRIRGEYQEDKKTYYPIRGLSDEESKDREEDLGGEKAGIIDLYVFRVTNEGADDNQLLASRGSGNLRRASSKLAAAGRPSTWADLQKQIASGMSKGRGLMALDPNLKEQDLEVQVLEGETFVDHMVITYWESGDESDEE